MAAKYFIDGTFCAPVCSLCLKLNFFSLSILYFSMFRYYLKIIVITFGCGFHKLISLVEI